MAKIRNISMRKTHETPNFADFKHTMTRNNF